MNHTVQISSIIDIAKKAGEIILKYYHTDTDVQSKVDASPLTIADLESNNFIREELARLTPDIPVISEETVPESYEVRREWDTFWLVDPLDGTKEFVKKTGQFTVNIGLISGGIPVLGVIEVPVMNQVYYADENGAWHVDRQYGSEPRKLQVRPLDEQQIDIVASRDHAGPMVQALSQDLLGAGFKSMGSSLKFCLVAAGEADVYLRDVPTMEWDTAAAHAILKAAGGEIYTLNGIVLNYNKESLRNPSILSIGPAREFWFDKISSIS